MSEDFPSQPDTNIPQRLALGLVDRDPESMPDWELPTLPLKGVLSWLWYEGNVRNHHHPVRAHNLALKELIVNGSLEH